MNSRNNDEITTKKFAIERRPMMLKDFLLDEFDSVLSNSSRVTNFPDEATPGNPPATLPRSRSRSRAAAEAAVSSFQKLLHSAAKSLHLITSAGDSPPVMLPRSLSKRLSTKFRWSRKKPKYSGEVVKVKVKDILRWRSFRDMSAMAEEQESPPLDPPAATVSGDGDGEFSLTADELPWWWGVKQGNGVVGSGDQLRGTTGAAESVQVGPDKEHNTESEEDKEQEQLSPVSVLDSPFRGELSDEEFVSSFDQSLATMEKRKQSLLQSIQLFESLAGVEEQSFLEEDLETEEVEEEEEDTEKKQEQRKYNAVIEDKSRAYMIRVIGKFRKGLQGLKDKEEGIEDMEKQGKWKKLEEEREEVGVEMEVGVFNDLVDEVLFDLFG